MNSTTKSICKDLQIKETNDRDHAEIEEKDLEKHQFNRTANIGVADFYHDSGEEDYDFEESSDAMYDYHDGYYDSYEYDDYEDGLQEEQSFEDQSHDLPNAEPEDDYDPEKHEAVEDLLQASQLEAIDVAEERYGEIEEFGEFATSCVPIAYTVDNLFNMLRTSGIDRWPSNIQIF